MSGAMSGASLRGLVETIFSTRGEAQVLDLVRSRLYSARPHPVAHIAKEAEMDHLMSFKDLQVMLGTSSSTARRWAKRHDVKPVYVLGCVRFWHSEVMTALQTQRGVLR
jgi:hypothetical protein